MRSGIFVSFPRRAFALLLPFLTLIPAQAQEVPQPAAPPPTPPANNTDKASAVAPRPKSQPRLDGFFTDDLRKLKFSAVLRFRIAIDAKGRSTVTLLQGSDSPELDRAVTRYVKAWRWEPAKQDGKPVSSSLTQTFTLKQR